MLILPVSIVTKIRTKLAIPFIITNVHEDEMPLEKVVQKSVPQSLFNL